AIAIRASVTVSIAAETSGSSSAIVRVSRVAVDTSFGRTADSAGTRSTSSNVSPSFANFSGSAASDRLPKRSTSIRKRYRGARASRLHRLRLELGDRDAALEPGGAPRIEDAGAELEGRSRAGRDGRAERVLAGAPGDVGGDEGREQGVAGADRRDRLDLRR